jgi:cysteine desulfurase
MENCRTTIARAVGGLETEIVFTSGGTESDNLALFGVAKRHLIVSAIEHSAVLAACSKLEAGGCAVTRIGVDSSGRVDPDAVIEAVRPDTDLVSIMLVNNETGAIQPISEIARRLRPLGVSVHTDAVQALGRIPVNVGELDVDLLSISAHKVHGPKGVGALYVRSGRRLEALVCGGDQEPGRRGGTENLPGIVGFAKAVELLEDGALPDPSLSELRDTLEDLLLKQVPGVCVCGSGARSPAVSCVVFDSLDGDLLMRRLMARGICVSSGSACTSGRSTPSHVLLAMGVEPSLARTAVRFSFSRDNTLNEVKRTAEVVYQLSKDLLGD